MIFPARARDIVLNGWEAGATWRQLRDRISWVGVEKDDVTESDIRNCITVARRQLDPRATKRTNAVYMGHS